MKSQELDFQISHLKSQLQDGSSGSIDVSEFDDLVDTLHDMGYEIVEQSTQPRSTSHQQFLHRRQTLDEMARGIQEAKNPAYAMDDEHDFHNNFRVIANILDVDEMVVWAVYYLKHIIAVLSYAKDPSTPQAEPLDERFADIRNYTEFGFSMYKERHETENSQ